MTTAIKGCLFVFLWGICWVIAGVIYSVAAASHAAGGELAALVVWGFMPGIALVSWQRGRRLGKQHPGEGAGFQRWRSTGCEPERGQPDDHQPDG